MDEEETHEEKSFSISDDDADMDADLLDMPGDDMPLDFGDKDENEEDPEDRYH